MPGNSVAVGRLGIAERATARVAKRRGSIDEEGFVRRHEDHDLLGRLDRVAASRRLGTRVRAWEGRFRRRHTHLFRHRP